MFLGGTAKVPGRWRNLRLLEEKARTLFFPCRLPLSTSAPGNWCMGSWPGGWEGGESHKASLPRMPKYLRRGQASGASSQTTALRCQTRKGGALPDWRQGLHGALHSGGAQRRCRVAQLSQARPRLFSRFSPAGVSWLGSGPAAPSGLPAVPSVFPQSHPPACPAPSQSSCGLQVCLLSSALSPSSPGMRSLVSPGRQATSLQAPSFQTLASLRGEAVGCRGPVTFPPALLLLDLFSSGCWPLRVLSFCLPLRVCLSVLPSTHPSA